MYRIKDLNPGYRILLIVAFLMLPLAAARSAVSAPMTENKNGSAIRADRAFIYDVVLPAKQAGRMTNDMRLSLERYMQLQRQPVVRAPGRDRRGGPDEGGYEWLDSDEEGGPAYEWMDISEIGQRLEPGDDWNSGRIDLGWNFNFYGTDYGSIYICSNGWVSFTSEQNWYTDNDLPNGNRDYGAMLAIQPFDLLPPEGAMFLYSNGEDQVAVVSWVDVPGWGGEAAQTFQVILRGDGSITYQYADNNDPNGENVVVGIQNANADIGLTVVSHEGGRLAAGYAVRFMPEEQGEPPVIAVNPQAIDVELLTGQTHSEDITISNNGAGALRFEVETDVISEPGRDATRRGLRQVNGELAGPRRDDVDLTDYRFAAFQDQESYGYIGDIAFSQVQDLDYDIYRNCDLAAADLQQYAAIIIAGANQSWNFYEQYRNNLALLEEYVDGGGALYYENGPDDDQNIYPPGDVQWQYQWEQNGNVIVSGDPGADNYNRLAELMGWDENTVIHGNAMFHCHYDERSFQNIEQSDWYQVIAVGQNSGQPGMVVYNWGDGVILLCGAPIGFVWRNYANPPDWGSGGEELLTYLVESVGAGWISVEPAEGRVEPDQQFAVTVTLNAEGLIQGDYEADLHFLSNDPENRDVAVRCHLWVEGAPDIGVEWPEAAGFPEFIDWNRVYPDLFNTGSYDIPITIANQGTAELAVDGVDPGNDDYSVSEDQFVLAPGDEQVVVITLSSDQSGVHEANLVISSNDPDQAEIEVFLRGETFAPPVISIDPQAIEVDNSEGEIIVREVTLINEGDAVLRWSSDLEVVSEPERDAGERDLRSVLPTNVGNAGPQRDDIDLEDMRFAVFQTDNAWGWLHEGILQGNQLLNDENFVWYRNPDDLSNIDFAQFDAIMFATGEQWQWQRGIYEQNIGRIEEYVANGGGAYYEMGNFPWELRYPAPGGIINDNDQGSGNGILAVSPDDGADNYSPFAQILHESQPDFWNEGEVIEGGSFLHSGFNTGQFDERVENGTIEWYQVIAVGQDNGGVPGVVAYQYGDGLVMAIGHPTGHTWFWYREQGMWGSVAAEILYFLATGGSAGWISWIPEDGEIAADGQQVVEVTINTVGLAAGNYIADLHILSNDPQTPDVAISIDLTVQEIPDILAEWEIGMDINNVDWNEYFIDLFTGFDYSVPITVINEGSGTLHVEDASADNGLFICDPVAFEVAPFSEGVVNFIFHADQNGRYEGTMTLTSDDPNESAIDIALVAVSSSPPVLEVDPMEIEVALFTGEMDDAQIDLTNSGGSDLRWNTDLLIHNEPGRDAGVSGRALRSVVGKAESRDPAITFVPDGNSANRQMAAAGPARPWHGGPTRDDVDLDGLMFAFFQSEAIWGFLYEGMLQDPLLDENNCVWFRNGDDWNNVDFEEYNVIVVGSYAQPWVQEYNNNLGRFEEYIDGGGAAYFETGDSWDQIRSPGGIWNDGRINSQNGIFTVSPEPQAENYSLLAEIFHESQPNNWNDGELIEGSSFLHSGYTTQQFDNAVENNQIEWYQVVAVHEGDRNMPGAVAYGLGSGIVLTVGHPVGFGWFNYNQEGMWGSLAAEILFYLSESGGSRWITWVPEEGTLERGANTEVNVHFDATGLLGGDYIADLLFLSNDPENPSIAVAITLQVTGAPDIAVEWEHGMEQNTVNWSDYHLDLFTGERYTVPVTIINDGTEVLIIEDISSDNQYFTCDPQQLQIEPRTDVVVDFVLLAQEHGLHEATMTITSDDVDEETIDILCVAQTSAPPIIIVDPQEIADDNDDEDFEDRVFTISNEGVALLRWSTDLVEIEQRDRDANRRTLRSVDGKAAGPLRDELDIEGMLFAIFETNEVWGSMINGMMQDPILDENNFHVYHNPEDWNNVEFSDYNAIAMNGYAQQYDQQYEDNRERLEEYIADGGGLYIETGSQYDRLVSPGGIRNDIDGWWANGTLLVSPNPDDENYSYFAEVVHGEQPDFWNAGELIEGSGWLHSNYSHQQFQDRLDDGTFEWFQPIASVENEPERWGAVTYGIGSGTVLTVGHPSGHAWFNWNRDGMWGSIAAEILYYLSTSGGPSWISWEPEEGEIEQGGSTDVIVHLNSVGVDQGDYEADIHVISNDPDNGDVVVNIRYHVTGYSDIALEWDIGEEQGLIDFNSYFLDLFTGIRYEVPVTVVNEGTAPLVVGEIAVEGEAFSVEPAALEIPIDGEAVVMVAIQTPGHGVFEGTVTFLSDDRDEAEVSISLRGETGAPPIIMVDPQGIEEALVTGEVVEPVLDIDNQGGSLLRWTEETQILQEGLRDAGSRTLRSVDGSVKAPLRDDLGEEIGRFQWNRAGVQNYKAGIAYDWDNDLMLLTAYSPQWMAIVDPDNDYQVVREWQPNFNPMGATWLNGVYYVIPWASDWLNTYDAEGNDLGQFRTPNHLATALTASPELGVLIIIDDWNNLDMVILNDQAEEIGRIGRDQYQRLNQGNWTRSLLWVDQHPDGQLWMNTMGHIWQMSIDVENWQLNGLVNDFQPQAQWPQEWDGLGFNKHDIIYGCWGNQDYIIYDDGVVEAYWITVVPDEGELDPGSNAQVSVILNATGLIGGDYIADLHFLSNDPETPDFVVGVTVHVTGAAALLTDPIAKPLADAPDVLEFPSTYIDGENRIVVELMNTGTEDLVVDGTDSDNEEFVSDLRDGQAIDPGESVFFNLIFRPADIGERQGRVSIFTNAENVGEGETEGDIWFDLIGLGQTPPEIATTPDADGWIRVGLPVGDDPVDRTLTIANVGGEGADDLDWSIVAEEVEEQRDAGVRTLRRINGEAGPIRDRRGGPDEDTYEWRDSDERDGPDYEWIDIIGREGAQNWQLGDDDGRQVQMGFEFPFYGGNSSNLWICSNGWVSFSQPRDGWQYWFEPWPEMPNQGVLINNALAVALTDWLQPGGGDTWFWSDGEMAVVTWNNIMHIDRDGSWTFQVIIYPNGYAQYQYAAVDPMINRGYLIGYQNENRDRGAQIFRGNQGYIVNGLAIGLGPRQAWGPPWLSIEPPEGSTAPGAESEVVLTFNTEGLEADTDYFADLTIESNDPTNPIVMINIQLTTGDVGFDPVWPYGETDQSHNLLITGITFDDEPVPFGWQVGVTTPEGVICGVGQWEEEDLGMAVWGADGDYPDQFEAGELMSLILWDPEADMEWPGTAVLEDGDMHWVNNGVTVLSIESARLQRITVHFEEGWNLISINIRPTDEALYNGDPGPEIIPMMAQLRIDENRHHVILMKNERGNFYAPAINNFNNIPFWNLAEGYQVKVDADVDATWEGERIPFDEDVPIASGWNMIAYYPSYELSCRPPNFIAINSILEHVIIVKDGDGFFGIVGRNFSNMPPWREGRGYQINVDQDVVLNYPAEPEQMAALSVGPKSDNTHWADLPSTGSNMSVLITRIAGVKLTANDQVGAFNAAGELVGVGRVTNGSIGLAVWGDDASTNEVDGLVADEAFTLKLWIAEKEIEVDLTPANITLGNGLTYQTDAFTVLAANVEAALPTVYSLGQNFPNPFNAVTRLSFGVPEASKVSVRVFDVAGRTVATLVDGELEAGNHVAVWDGANISAGVYIVKMEALNFSAVRKVTLLK